MGLERRGCVVQPWPLANRKREEPVDEAKPFKIPKREVWEAFKRAKANQGAAGVDEQSIAESTTSVAGSTTTVVSTSRPSYPTLRRIDLILARWAHRKFKSLRRHKRRTYHWLSHIVRRQPDLFAHWRLLYGRGRAMGAG